MALVTQIQNNWGVPAPDNNALFGTLVADDPTWPGADLTLTGWVFQDGDLLPTVAPGQSIIAASLQLDPISCALATADLEVVVNAAFAVDQTGPNNLLVAAAVTDGLGSVLVGPTSNGVVGPSPTVLTLTLPLSVIQAQSGLWVTVAVSPANNGIPLDLDSDVLVTAEATLTFDDAACNPAAGCVGEASHLDDCGVSQWAELLQQTVDALRPQVRWSCICDDGAPGVTAWQQWSSADNGLTWTLLGTFTEKYGSTPYAPVGALVNCSTIGTPATGTRARRAVLTAGSTTAVPYGQVAPPLPGLPLVGSLVESLSWSSRNATGTITDAAGTVSTFVAGEGDTWSLEWTDTIEIAVTTGEVVVTWSEVY